MDSEVTKKEILKHYFSSLFVYGVILCFITFCPLVYDSIQNPVLNYITVFGVYYLLYAIFALPVFFKLKPLSIKNSRNVAIVEYIKRQFAIAAPLQKIQNLEPTEDEKQAFAILFIKAFFGVTCVNLLCNKYFPSIDYDIDFMKEIFVQAVTYSRQEGFLMGLFQFIDDSNDMLVTIMLMISTTILAISYITETEFLKNKIKYADITPLGMVACLMCFYPFTLISSKLFPVYSEELIPVDNMYFRVILSFIIILVNFISVLAILRLGTKSGNLTNRGIVTGFPYNIVRHPDYSSQILMIITLSIPIFFNPELLLIEKILYPVGVCAWIAVYYLRAITEERNLVKDEKYKDYMSKVKYRFIPWIC